jgi:hypothetical protein
MPAGIQAQYAFDDQTDYVLSQNPTASNFARFLTAPPTLVVVEIEPELTAVKGAEALVAPGEVASPTIPSKPVANKIAPFVPTLKGKMVVEPRES